LQAHVEGLRKQLLRAPHVTERAPRVRAAAGDDVRPPALGPDSLRHSLKAAGQVRAGLDHLDTLGAQEVEEEVVADRVRPVAPGHALLNEQPALETLACGCGQGQAAVVGLGRAHRDQGVGALRQRIRDQELELPGLVASASQPQQVVALDPYLGTAQRLG
jgi:hypothetical protein